MTCHDRGRSLGRRRGARRRAGGPGGGSWSSTGALGGRGRAGGGGRGRRGRTRGRRTGTRGRREVVMGRGEEGEVEVALLSELVGEDRGGEGGGREPGLRCVREGREGRVGSSVLFL